MACGVDGGQNGPECWKGSWFDVDSLPLLHIFDPILEQQQ